MSLITGKSICKRCTHDIANEDMAGDICIECLNEIERMTQQDKDEPDGGAYREHQWT